MHGKERVMSGACGILIVNKPGGITSHDVVNRVRRLYGTRQVGHTGTLDPLACGVLAVMVGRAAKAAQYLNCDRKSYRAVLRLGLTSDTEDITGRVLTQSDRIPDADAVRAVCAGFVGEQMQIPPMYSALKVGGQKLCDLARRGEQVEREAREITVYSLTCTPAGDPAEYILDVSCSAGTYIRTLCADIGAALGCGGVMKELTRTAAGRFTLAEALTLTELEEMTVEERIARLLPTEALFADLPAIALPAFYERLCRCGCEIYLKKIHVAMDVGQRVRLCNADGGFFAVGEVGEYADGIAVKALTLFEL